MKMKKLAPLSCGLLLALVGSLGAAETALIDTNTPWRTYLVVGPTLRWQNGAENVWPSKGGGQLRVGNPGARGGRGTGGPVHPGPLGNATCGGRDPMKTLVLSDVPARITMKQLS
jgi:hypothetical protein